MKLGVSAFAWAGKLEPWLLDLLPTLRALGLQGFEIPMFEPAKLPVEMIKRAFESAEMECTVCAILPPQINPIDSDADMRKRSIEHLRLCVKTTADMGSKLLGGPLYAPIGYLPGHRPGNDEWQWAVETFHALGDMLDLYDVTLCLEPVNRSETFFLRTAVEARRLCDAVGHPKIGITIDTFHANIEERNIPAAVRSAGDRLKHMHMSENDRGVLGEGHVNFPKIVTALQQIGYRGYLMIEGFGYLEHVNDSPGALWADKNAQPITLADRGASYLRSLLNNVQSREMN